MLVLTFIIAIIALIISIVAYQRAGGTKELRRTVDSLSSTMESLKERTAGTLREQIEHLTSITESVRDKTSEVIGKLEAAVRRIREEEKPREKRPSKRPGELRERMPSSEDFQRGLDSIFASAEQEDKPSVEVKSGDLHRSVGGYPGHVHRLPTCCRVMIRNMKAGDEILQQPAKGTGATLTIRFKLPR